MRTMAFIVVLFFTTQVSAQETFTLPTNPKGSVIVYLGNMKVKDPARHLSEAEKHAICRLFVKAYAISIRKHRQDYSINTGAPIYRLLVSNFPEVASREGEGKSIIFLGAITGFFNSLPEYRSDVVQVLRQGINGEYCKPLAVS